MLSGFDQLTPVAPGVKMSLSFCRAEFGELRFSADGNIAEK
jgi:hypothetical protein